LRCGIRACSSVQVICHDTDLKSFSSTAQADLAAAKEGLSWTSYATIASDRSNAYSDFATASESRAEMAAA
jgi:hypothetical protein